AEGVGHGRHSTGLCREVRGAMYLEPQYRPPYNNDAMRPSFALLPVFLLAACASLPLGPPTQPNDREWNLLATDYAWIESLRKAQPAPPVGASRKQMIEMTLANLQKIEPALNAFLGKVTEYYDRTHDVRAAQVLAR